MSRTVTICRKKQAIDPFTGIYVYIDGQQIGVIKNGEEASFTIDENRHLLKVGLSVSPESDLSPSVIREGSENYRFTVYIKKGFLIDKAILEEQYSPQPAGGPAEYSSSTAATGMAAFCPNCGYKLRETDNFCPKCGQKRTSL